MLRAIQSRGPLSRAEVARHSGMSAPTASRAVESLLRAGFLEEGDAPEAARGRPARKLHLATSRAQVLGLVLDAGVCRLVAAGLDGRLHEERALEFPTPATYEELLDAAEQRIREVLLPASPATLALGITLPGLMDYRRQSGVLSPNLPMTNGRRPGVDLSERLGLECVVIQESHALCLAERIYGDARGLDDFAMLDVSTGVGLGVMSGGRLLMGHSGLAGEIGHITVQPDGLPCGCGNFGCLETVACDSAVARRVSARLGRPVDIETVLELAARGEANPAGELDTLCRYLGIGLAAVLNLFNPSAVFVHGKLFAADPALFDRLLQETRRRCLPPSFADCRLVLARGSKRQGAVAAVIEHLTESLAPSVGIEPSPRLPEIGRNGHRTSGAEPASLAR